MISTEKCCFDNWENFTNPNLCVRQNNSGFSSCVLAKVYNLGNSIMGRDTYIIADLDELSLIFKKLARGTKYYVSY